MKVAFLELSGSEPLVLNPPRYGGGSRVPTFLREKTDYCWTFGNSKCFEALSSVEKADKCIVINQRQIDKIRNGESVLKIIPDIIFFDIVFHTEPSISLNLDGLKIKEVVWAVGYMNEIHENHKYLLLHNATGQKPILKNKNTQSFQFILGSYFPSFKQREKQDFLIQVTNHYPQIQSHIVAQLCNKNEIKCYFAGPVSAGYDEFLKSIDNINTFYLGEISEEKKISLLEDAIGFVGLYAHDINEIPLSFKQALGYGCLIISTPIGDVPWKIKNDYNGFLISDSREFIQAWNKRKEILQWNCYTSIQKYNIDNMIKSLDKIFNYVHQN